MTSLALHFFISIINPQCQSSHTFEEFPDNLQVSIDKISDQNPFLTVVLNGLMLNLQFGITALKQHMKALHPMQYFTIWFTTII